MKKGGEMLKKRLLVVVLGLVVSQLFFSGTSWGRECLWVEHFDSDSSIKRGELTKGKIGKGFFSQNPGDCAVFDSKGKINLKEGTIEMWVKPNWDGSDKNERPLFDIVGTPEWWNRFVIVKTSKGKLMFDIVSGKETVKNIWAADNHITVDISNWEKGKWYQITATWKNVNSDKRNAKIELYINGKRYVKVNRQITITKLGEKIFLGANANPKNRSFWNGVIDEVAIYDYAKSEEEILFQFEEQF